MIFTATPHTHRYAHLHPLLGEAFAALREFDPATLDGRLDLRGDDLFLNVERYTTQPADQRRFESHRTYLDVQTIFTGRESIYVEPTDRLDIIEPYDADRDVVFYSGPHDTRLDLHPGDLAIFFPEDGHKPVCVCGGPAEVLKVVAKVRL
ncbi:MAG: YhcH/YjgK/YiaL family protein [Planctomycetota bacterium]